MRSEALRHERIAIGIDHVSTDPHIVLAVHAELADAVVCLMISS